MTALEIAINALKEIEESTNRDGDSYLIHFAAKEALADIRRAQYLEAQPPTAPDVMRESLE